MHYTSHLTVGGSAYTQERMLLTLTVQSWTVLYSTVLYVLCHVSLWHAVEDYAGLPVQDYYRTMFTLTSSYLRRASCAQQEQTQTLGTLLLVQKQVGLQLLHSVFVLRKFHYSLNTTLTVLPLATK